MRYRFHDAHTGRDLNRSCLEKDEAVSLAHQIADRQRIVVAIYEMRPWADFGMVEVCTVHPAAPDDLDEIALGGEHDS